MIRSFVWYLDLSWRLALVALAGVIFIGAGLIQNWVDNLFAYSPWRRFS